MAIHLQSLQALRLLDDFWGVARARRHFGTLVGLYETAVDRLASVMIGGATVRPKVVASTATMRRASLQTNAIFGGEKTAMNFPGSLNGEAYEVYANEILCPTLQAGDIVVMDNLRVHQNQKVRDMIEARGASLWYLPPYSPHLNPIEECWSKFKTILRTVAARTREALDDGITHALKQIHMQDIRGWFEHSGYLPASG